MKVNAKKNEAFLVRITFFLKQADWNREINTADYLCAHIHIFLNEIRRTPQ